jgi:hypothetical protein
LEAELRIRLEQMYDMTMERIASQWEKKRKEKNEAHSIIVKDQRLRCGEDYRKERSRNPVQWSMRSALASAHIFFSSI